jgi:hypothetical protein
LRQSASQGKNEDSQKPEEKFHNKESAEITPAWPEFKTRLEIRLFRKIFTVRPIPPALHGGACCSLRLKWPWSYSLI